jgi:hypothetical protein
MINKNTFAVVTDGFAVSVKSSLLLFLGRDRDTGALGKPDPQRTLKATLG